MYGIFQTLVQSYDDTQANITMKEVQANKDSQSPTVNCDRLAMALRPHFKSYNDLNSSLRNRTVADLEKVSEDGTANHPSISGNQCFKNTVKMEEDCVIGGIEEEIVSDIGRLALGLNEKEKEISNDIFQKMMKTLIDEKSQELPDPTLSSAGSVVSYTAVPMNKSKYKRNTGYMVPIGATHTNILSNATAISDHMLVNTGQSQSSDRCYSSSGINYGLSHQLSFSESSQKGLLLSHSQEVINASMTPDFIQSSGLDQTEMSQITPLNREHIETVLQADIFDSSQEYVTNPPRV
ncbi:unnamed protein product [Protopolystoma xenopodis]|uniref:Uncharacterized protein n=1 Tax=Protopolystoma xenopodis TaxID=117903 RepID=A0A3S5B2D6_9PLAT|nr:unnamed protein product [Protopolystoma xenopodis]